MESTLIKLWIDNQWTVGEKSQQAEITNPSTLKPAGTVALASRADAQKALVSAEKAFSAWSNTTGEQRAVLMKKGAEAVLARQEELARLLTLEHGKPLADSLAEVKGAAGYLVYYAEEARRIGGEIAPAKSATSRSLVIKQPRGVVTAIAPWNYPVVLMAWKIAPALAAGCTVVAKPSLETPLACTLFCSIIAGAGFPPGVLIVINGKSAEIGDELVINPISRTIAFTGSTATGVAIAAKAAPGFKKLILELGGQTPMIIFKDAQLDKAVADAVKRSYRNMGQICNAVNRIFVEKEITEEFSAKFIQLTRKMTIGDGLVNPKIDLGPMVNEEGLNRTRDHIQDALRKGGELRCGGKRPEQPDLPPGYYYEPTLLTNVRQDMLVMKEETFGPLAAIDTFQGVSEAIEKANSTRYGLVSYVYTENLRTAFVMMEKIQSGTVAVNSVSPDSIYAPYPAWKDSGIGLELGRYGLDEYLQTKHCLLDLG